MTLKEMVYTISFIDKCFKKFLDRSHLIKPSLATVEKKSSLLVLPYLWSIFLQVNKNKK